MILLMNVDLKLCRDNIVSKININMIKIKGLNADVQIKIYTYNSDVNSYDFIL